MKKEFNIIAVVDQAPTMDGELALHVTGYVSSNEEPDGLLTDNQVADFLTKVTVLSKVGSKPLQTGQGNHFGLSLILIRPNAVLTLPTGFKVVEPGCLFKSLSSMMDTVVVYEVIEEIKAHFIANFVTKPDGGENIKEPIDLFQQMDLLHRALYDDYQKLTSLQHAISLKEQQLGVVQRQLYQGRRCVPTDYENPFTVGSYQHHLFDMGIPGYPRHHQGYNGPMYNQQQPVYYGYPAAEYRKPHDHS